MRASNTDTQILVRAQAPFAPEEASFFGIPGYDDQVYDLKPDVGPRFRAAMTKARDELRGKLATERDPMPDAELWRSIDDPRARLGAGLAAIYAWYERNASLTACVVRDAEYHPLTREIAAMRSGPYFDAYRAVLGEKLTARQQAMLALSVTFHTWRTLVDERGLTSEAAAGLMTDAVAGA